MGMRKNMDSLAWPEASWRYLLPDLKLHEEFPLGIVADTYMLTVLGCAQISEDSPW